MTVTRGRRHPHATRAAWTPGASLACACLRTQPRGPSRGRRAWWSPVLALVAAARAWPSREASTLSGRDSSSRHGGRHRAHGRRRGRRERDIPRVTQCIGTVHSLAYDDHACRSDVRHRDWAAQRAAAFCRPAACEHSLRATDCLDSMLSHRTKLTSTTLFAESSIDSPTSVRGEGNCQDWASISTHATMVKILLEVLLSQKSKRPEWM